MVHLKANIARLFVQLNDENSPVLICGVSSRRRNCKALPIVLDIAFA
jgi:hypothetical protein